MFLESKPYSSIRWLANFLVCAFPGSPVHWLLPTVWCPYRSVDRARAFDHVCSSERNSRRQYSQYCARFSRFFALRTTYRQDIQSLQVFWEPFPNSSAFYFVKLIDVTYRWGGKVSCTWGSLLRGASCQGGSLVQGGLWYREGLLYREDLLSGLS